jgi:serine/threonine protein kinase/Tfp pilus assembly protein PilF
VRPDQWDEVQSLLDRAAALDEQERRRYVEEQTEDPQVRREVLSLLGYGSEAFLHPAQMQRLAADELHPETIGNYRISRVLGEGGMGVVYQALQERPVRRTVAIKVVRMGMATHEVVARFETERQALAMMSHPNIARVFDAGMTEAGRPYFVMEYVEGVPITRHCDEARLGTRERLALFLQVCDGIQHAHQKGIIHRDIKPSNVLVASQDGAATPKIIDFGIAKATGRGQAQATLLTQVGQIVGTLAYMSPEQASLTGYDVDVRTDVYSLGVLLYELLVGRLPFDTRPTDVAFDEICRRIREVDPPRPSTCVRTIGPESRQIATRRQTDVAAFLRDLQGDLDWVVMKALEKQADRRYPSASEFAADVGRYLTHQPVAARPPSARYRLRKFVRRHRFGVASAAVIAVLLAAGTVGTAVGLLRSRISEKRALAEARTAERLADYFVDIFRSADPEQGPSITAQAILDAKAQGVLDGKTLAEEPGVRGRVMAAMGEAYMGLGMFGKAKAMMEQALPLLRASYGEQSEAVYNVVNELGQLASKLGDHEAARGYYEQALALAERTLGPDHPHIPPILKNLGEECRWLEDLPAARGYLQRSLELRTALHGEESMAVARTLGSLARLEADSGNFDRALPLARRSLEVRQALLEPDAPGIGYGYLFLADVQLAAGANEDALASYQAALAIWEPALGAEHENVRALHLRLARTYLALGDRDRAWASYERSYHIARATYPEDDPDLAPSLARYLDEYADFLVELGRPAEADGLRQDAVAIRTRLDLSR